MKAAIYVYNIICGGGYIYSGRMEVKEFFLSPNF
jgi:hypothetical protein